MKGESLNVPKALAIAMLSKIAIIGTEMTVLPSSPINSSKLYVWFPFRRENGGGEKAGKPFVMLPVILNGLTP